MNESPVRKNRTALALLLGAMLLSILLFSLPLYTFQISTFQIKSPNTAVGSEKYAAIRVEAEAAAEACKKQGLQAEIIENVTERTRAGGEKTSLVELSVELRLTKNLWSFFTADFPSSRALAVMALCALASVLCALFGSVRSLGVPHERLARRERVLRDASGWLALAALLAVPVFVMMNTYLFGHQFRLFDGGILTEGRELFYARLGRFLLQDAAGITLRGLDVSVSGFLWLLVPCFFVMLLSAIELRCGAIKDTLLKGLLYVFVVIVCLITVYPYYVMLVTAFRSSAETIDMNFVHLFPTKWQWANLLHIIDRGIPGFLLNSLLIAGGATLLTMFCGIPAAYALARMKFRGKKVFLGFVIMSQMFSPVVLLIGISQLANSLGLNNTIWGLMLVNAAFNQAFAVWLLRGTFASISPEMEHAAMIDGCGRFGAVQKVLLPMAAPGIVTALIFVFINAWNEYTVSTVLISTASRQPITVGITQFSSFNMIEWRYLFAASLVATIPVLILFLCIEKHLTSGLTAGGVKG